MVAFSTWKRTLSTEQILNTYTQWTLITYLSFRRWTYVYKNKLEIINSSHIIWEALNCLLSVMFECHFVNGLYIQTSLAVNCLPATSDRYYPTYAQKWWSGKLFKKKKKNLFFGIFTSGKFCLTPGSAEVGCISERLSDDLGGLTCMQLRQTLLTQATKSPNRVQLRRAF